MNVIGDITSGTAMCHDCMLTNGHERKDKGFHTATIAHCCGCDTAKPLLSVRHWAIKNTESVTEE